MTEQTQERKNVAIIGAGITGLSAAYYLQQAGHSAVIFEKSNRVGGIIQTTEKDGYRLEHGPNTLMVNDKRVADLIKSVGLEPELIVANQAANKRFVVHQRKLHTLPSSPTSFLTSSLFSLSGKMRALKEPFISKLASESSSESFADFIRRRFGPEMLEKAAGPFVSGIYAGDPNRLSTRFAFPNIYRCEQQSGSVFKGLVKAGKEAKKGETNRLAKREIISFKDGMEALPKAVADMLNDDTIITEADISSISFNKKSKRWNIGWKAGKCHGQGSFSDLIITVPAHKLEDLPFDTHVSDVLDEVTKVQHLDYPPVTAMVLGFKKEQVNHPLDGFGMLNALNEKSKMLGALFISTLFENRAPEGHVSINVMLGGARTPEHAKMADSAMKASVMDELRQLLGIEGNPTFSNIVRWEKAIPQLNLGYSNILAQLEQCERKYPGIHFAGNYRGGISVGDCIISGIKLSQTISN
ncbi:protoporphyrinogen oxidase [Rubritalea spongiae]|uniref:Coproporphyrinogen III oxidase n=1 Tax=Rubritalea spongiae TaxID=430797 RepID=A0ABW5E400_9BACT